MLRCRCITVAFAAAWLAFVTPARAQGPLVQGTVSAVTGQGDTALALGGSVGYRFNRVLGLAVDITHMPRVASDVPRIYGRGGDEGRITMFTTNVRVEMPTLSRRVIPYLVGGGGVAGVTREFDAFDAAASALAGMSRPGAVFLMPGRIMPGPIRLESTSVNMALTLGGGVSFLLTDRLSLDGDLRAVSLLGDARRTMGRFGAGVSYRF